MLTINQAKEPKACGCPTRLSREAAVRQRPRAWAFFLGSCLIAALVPPASVAAQSARPSGPGVAVALVAQAKVTTDRAAQLSLLEDAIRQDPNNAEAYFLRGEIRRLSGQALAALEDFDVAIQKVPQNAPGYVAILASRADCYLQLNRPDETVREATAAIEKMERYSFAYLVRARGEFRNGLYEEAIKDLDCASELGTSSAPWQMQVTAVRADILRNQQRFPEALQAYDAVLQLATGDANTMAYALKNKSGILRQQKAYDDALGAALKAVELAPADWEAHETLGAALLEKTDYAGAAKAFSAAVELNSQAATSYAGRAAASLRLGRPEEALADVARSLKANPDSSYAYQVQGLIFHNMMRYEEALVSHTKAAELNPRDTGTLTNRAITHLAMHQCDLAVRDADAALGIDPSCAAAYIAKGDVEAALGRKGPRDGPMDDPGHAKSDYQWGLAPAAGMTDLAETPSAAATELPGGDPHLSEALKHYARATELDSHLPGPYCGTASVLVRQGKFEDALKAVDRAVQLGPQWAIAYSLRGHVNRRMQKWPEAVEDFTKALDLTLALSDRPSALACRADSHGNLGQLLEGLADADEAVRLQTDYQFGRFVKVKLLRALKRYDEATAEADALIRLDDQNPGGFLQRALAKRGSCEYQAAADDVTRALDLLTGGKAQAYLASSDQLAKYRTHAYLDRAMLYMCLAQYPDAVSDIARAMREGDSARALAARARCLAWLGKPAEALADLKAASEAVSADGNAAYESGGVVYAILGDYHAAAEQFAKAADATSGSAGPLLVFVYSARAGKAADGAAAQSAKRLMAIVDRPGGSPWRITLAKLYLGEGTEKDALAAIPEDPPFLRREAECEVFFHLGAWRQMRGDIRDAREFYEKCLGTGVAHFIEYGLAKAELQRLQKQ